MKRDGCERVRYQTSPLLIYTTYIFTVQIVIYIYIYIYGAGRLRAVNKEYRTTYRRTEISQFLEKFRS
jgi:hypothetical protein